MSRRNKPLARSIYKGDFVLFYFLYSLKDIKYANFQLRLSGKLFDGAGKNCYQIW